MNKDPCFRPFGSVIGYSDFTAQALGKSKVEFQGTLQDPISPFSLFTSATISPDTREVEVS